MAILGSIVFALFFVLLAPTTRNMLFGVVAGAGDWIEKWAPFSYIALALVLIVPTLAAIVLIKWPQPPEPENPLARYKGGEDVLED
ncbi:MAG: hypothetical protein LAP40_26050 [Acidobacteriia bacterium]|nr:hypothetical protein [Terriglobia bacterium]